MTNNPIQTLYDTAVEQLVDVEIIDAALAEAYRNGETAGSAGKEEKK